MSEKKAELVDLGAYTLTYHKPVIKVAGREIKCEHKWGHEDPKVARRCAVSMATEAGAVLADAAKAVEQAERAVEQLKQAAK
jgi:hypothetical protein